MTEKEYENICDNCSKSFTTTDEDAVICPACWQKIIGENEGIGKTETTE